ncbi:MAG TPA: response regulator [Spirochaetes bacterium]|nr:response regulator [Spirochaetota bacterium]
MLSKSQFDLVLSLLTSILTTTDLDDYLKQALEMLAEAMSPQSAAVYIPIESEEKLVLIKKLGVDFDQQINAVHNFSLIVRKSVKKKSVMFIPVHGEEEGGGAERLITLMPLIGADKHMGLVGMVFDGSEESRHRASANYYQFLSRVIGFAAHVKRMFAADGKKESYSRDETYKDRIKNLGVLSSGVSHEFNNIFAVIKGYAELIAMSAEDMADVQNAVRNIDEQTERAARLIESLQVFVRGRNVKLAYHSLNEIVEEVVSVHRTVLANEHIEIRLELKDSPRVLVDRERVKEALLNLLQNSIHSIEPGAPGELVISTSVKDDAVALSVIDNGRGMSAEQAEMVIHPFSEKNAYLRENGDEESRGAFLRLAIAHGIMRNHGGRMEIVSAAGKGKEIRLLFSRVELGEEDTARYDERDVLFIGDTRILVVDDEEPIREILTRAFENMGYQALSVASGDEAVEICGFEDIDIVFLDYLMPGTKGDRVFDSIKKLCPDTDIIIITGVEEVPNIEKMLDSGLVTVLKKPFKIEKIIKITNDLIFKRIKRKQ